jgi:4-amino-4-deoxychorismate lyase
MGRKILFDGQMKFADCVNIRPDSPALNFGCGLFETILYENGEIFFLPEHIERIKLSCRALRLPEPNINFIKESLILNLIEENKLFDGPARLKIMYAPLIIDREWNIVVFASAYERCTAPAALKVDPNIRDNFFNRHKTLSYMQNFLAKTGSKEYDETLFVNHSGYIIEGSSTNVISVKHNILHYPACETNCLRGIMQDKIIHSYKELGFDGAVAVKGGIPLDFVRGSEEILITNSLIIARNAGSVRYRNEELVFAKTDTSEKIRKFFLNITPF